MSSLKRAHTSFTYEDTGKVLENMWRGKRPAGFAGSVTGKLHSNVCADDVSSALAAVASALAFLRSNSHGQNLDQVICVELIGFVFQAHPLPLRIFSARATAFFSSSICLRWSFNALILPEIMSAPRFAKRASRPVSALDAAA